MDVRTKFVAPVIKSDSFNCPHCGALAKQDWYKVISSSVAQPAILYERDREKYESMVDKNDKKKIKVFEKIDKLIFGKPCFYKSTETIYSATETLNLNISECYSCNDIAVWLYDKLLWPQIGAAPLPNPDLPDELLADYLEASAILDKSPRGAAALLRLVIQKLCIHLGGNNQNLNEAIGVLVENGLSKKIQKALDTVRVIGNNMVHPGKMDIEDDRATAETLFKLVNLIVEKTISEEKEINEIYNSLPDGALTSIEKRDSKKT